jgi:hypothetical protein
MINMEMGLSTWGTCKQREQGDVDKEFSNGQRLWQAVEQLINKYNLP